MPTVDDELQRRIHRAAPIPSDTATVEGIYRRKHRRSIVRRASAVGVVVLVLAGALVAFAAVDRPNTLVTPGVSTPAPLADDLGLPFPTCRVSSMPMTSELGGGSAAVFTKESDGGCPKANDGFVGVGVDVTGDGLLDATAGPLPDCYFKCEAFAAPDVNGDGVSEIAVSTAGADGFGVWLYAVTTTPPSIEPIIVSSTLDQWPSGDPLQFAWVDVATHASSAGCDTTGDLGTVFQLYSIEKLTPAQVQTTSMLIEGSSATVTGISNDTMQLGEAPMPGTELCGAPLYGSAAGLGTYAASAMCDVATMSGDVDGDEAPDTVSIGTMVRADSSCPSHGMRILTIDLGADGTFDVRTGPPDCSTWCVPFALADLNSDGTAEVLLNEGHLAPPVSAKIGVYELREGMLLPVSFPDGMNRFPLQNSWQGYFGAYCSNPDTFWLWEGTTDQGGTLRSTTATGYRLNVGALRFEETGQHGTTLNSIPADTGYDGRVCGADTQALG